MFYSRCLLITATLMIAICSDVQAAVDDKKSEQQVKQFSALPATCITLRQGRKCFATITISLKLTKVGDYCIYQQGRVKPIRCWYNATPNVLSLNFESSQTTIYSLKNEQSQQVLATTSVKVSWAHQTITRKRRWRIF